MLREAEPPPKKKHVNDNSYERRLKERVNDGTAVVEVELCHIYHYYHYDRLCFKRIQPLNPKQFFSFFFSRVFFSILGPSIFFGFFCSNPPFLARRLTEAVSNPKFKSSLRGPVFPPKKKSRPEDPGCRYDYIYIYLYTIYIPGTCVCPLFWGVKPPREGQTSNQNSRVMAGFQVKKTHTVSISPKVLQQ